MTDTKHPEALRLAALYDADAWPGGLSLNAWAAASAAELRRLHAENTTLQQGYDAARLEIEALRMRSAEPAGEYPPLPDPKFTRVVDGVPCITLLEHGLLMRAYVDADRSMRSAQAAPAINAGDAVFAFAGILTSLPHVVPFGSAAWATPGVELAIAFNTANSLTVSVDFPTGIVFPKIEDELLAVIETASQQSNTKAAPQPATPIFGDEAHVPAPRAAIAQAQKDSND